MVTGPAWEHFPHEADMGVRGRGATKEQAFEQAALAMTAVSVDPRRIALREELRLRCAAPDDEVLLVDWLNEIVAAQSARRMVFGRFSVRLGDGALEGTAWGEPVEPERHEPAVEVKGATYTCLRVGRDDDGSWVAQCVVDV
jgi:tRNA nucleotidyltransferase (CCA-adding enzyme)